MSTCSTATSAVRCHESPRRRAPPTCDVEAVHGRLERCLVDLQRDWDAYKTGRPGAPRHRHRRSRSATGTPSSAVTVAAPDDDLLLLLFPLLRRYSSPRRLVSSLQQTTSADNDCAAEIVGGAGSPAGSYGEGPSSVCFVEVGYPVAASSSPSCTCPCRCAVCRGGYSTSSSCTGDAAPSFSLMPGGALGGERARKKSDEARSAEGTGRAAWIFAAIGLVVMGVVAMVILELSADDGRAEYLVPT